jgi:hypothetical protein
MKSACQFGEQIQDMEKKEKPADNSKLKAQS